MRLTWKLLSSLTCKSQPTSLLDSFTVDGVNVTDKCITVEKFNEYFVNIGAKLAASIPPASNNFAYYLKNNYMQSLALLPTDATEIINIVSGFENKRSSGFDGIPVNILKFSIYAIAEPLAALINNSITNGVFQTH